jgi:hypothetical protein
VLELSGLYQGLPENTIVLKNCTKNEEYPLTHHLSDYQIRSIRAGSVLTLAARATERGD